MRIAHVCESFSPSSETFIYDSICELDRQKVECHVVTISRVNEKERPYDNEKVHVTPWPGRWNIERLWARFLTTFKIRGDVKTHKWPALRNRMRDKFERIRPDIVHAHFGPMGVMVAPIAHDLNIPLVVSFMGYDASVLPRKERMRHAYLSLFDHSDVLIGISNHICGILKNLGANEEKVHLWHLGTNVDQFPYSSPADRYEGGDVRLLHVGRLVEKKAPVDLVNAIWHAKEKLGDQCPIHLTIAGDGPLREVTEQRVHDLLLKENVTFLGQVSHAQVQQLMQTSHLYTQHCKTASNGDQEGQGVTFVEASAVGLPIVTTRHNGIPDVVIDGETGYLVEEGDVEAMGERIAYLATHPETWEVMGKAGRRHVEEHFDVKKQTSKLGALYEKILN